jgi:hypothetical protein
MSEVLMPLIQYQLFVFLRKLLGFGQVIQLEAMRFPQFDTVRDLEDRFGAGFDHVNMNRFVVVAVEAEAEAVVLEYFRH